MAISLGVFAVLLGYASTTQRVLSRYPSQPLTESHDNIAAQRTQHAMPKTWQTHTDSLRLVPRSRPFFLSFVYGVSRDMPSSFADWLTLSPVWIIAS